MTADPKLPGEPLTPEQVHALDVQFHGLSDIEIVSVADCDRISALCDSHEALRAALRLAREEAAAAWRAANGNADAGLAMRAAQLVIDSRTDQREMLRAALRRAKEHAAELRGYCDGWEWKYGEGWDAEDAAIEAALTPTPGSSAGGNDAD